MTYLFDSPNIKFMITYILQYEISLRMKFSNIGHDLLFQVMTQLTSYHTIGLKIYICEVNVK